MTIKVSNNNAAVSVLQRTKQADGSYIITLPINTSDEVYTNIDEGEVLSDRLLSIKNTESSMLDDMATLLLKMSPLVTGNLNLNHIFKDDFKTVNNISVTTGNHEPGALSGERIVYQLANGIKRDTRPRKITIKDIKNREVVEGEVSVYVSVNFEDINVYWIDCTQEYLQQKAINIPYLDGKEADKPWNINVKFTFNCPDNAVTISDLVIAHV